MSQEIYDQMVAEGAPDLRQYDNSYFYRLERGGYYQEDFIYLIVMQHEPRWWNKNRSVQIGGSISFHQTYINPDAPDTFEPKYWDSEMDAIVSAALMWQKKYERLLEDKRRTLDMDAFLGDHP